jgi:hypothetical protein
MVGQSAKISKKKEVYLTRIYFNPKEGSSFTSPSSLLKEVKRRGKYSFTVKQVTDFLSKFDAYTLARQRKQRFKKVPYISKYLYEMVQIDLVDMGKYSKHNDNYKYWLTLIDCFSRKLFLEMIRDKKAETVLNAFKSILSLKT